MADIRLYTFEGGILRKSKRIKHSFKSVEDCKKAIDSYCMRAKLSTPITRQYVIVEYSGIFSAKIIEVFEKTHNPC